MTIKHSTLKGLCLLLFFLFSITTHTYSQTYWDVEFDGNPVREVVEIKYDKWGVLDTITRVYYNDGKLKSEFWSHRARFSEEDTLWTRGEDHFAYDNGELISICQYFNGKEFGYGQVIETYLKIFPKKYNGYDSEISALKGNEPNVIIELMYDKSNRLIQTNNIGKRDTLIEKITYKKKEKVSKTLSRRGQKLTIYYEVIKKGPYGWIEIRNVTDSTTTTRTFTEFSKNELNDSNFAPKKYASSVNLEQIQNTYYKAYSGQKKTDSIMARLFVIGINIFENDLSKVEETGTSIKYFPFKTYYGESIRYYAHNKQEELALDITKRAFSFFEKDLEFLQFLYDQASLIYEKLGNYDQALQYLEKIDLEMFDEYDTRKYLTKLRIIKLTLLAGDEDGAEDLIIRYKKELPQNIDNPDFNANNIQSDKELDSFDKLAEIYELKGDYAKAAQYVSVYKDFIALLYGETSEAHIAQTERLIRLKKAALK